MLSLTGVLHAETVVEGFNPYAEKVSGCLSRFTSAKTNNEEKMALSVRQKLGIQWTIVIVGFISSVLGGFANYYRRSGSYYPEFRFNGTLDPEFPFNGTLNGCNEWNPDREHAGIALGVTAAVLLLFVQAIVTGVAISRWWCCGKRPPVSPRPSDKLNNRVTIVAFVSSWILFAFAFLILLLGSHYYGGTDREERCRSGIDLSYLGISLLLAAIIVLNLFFVRAAWASHDGKTVPPASSEVTLGQIHPSYTAPPYGDTQSRPYPYGQFPHPAQDTSSYPPLKTGQAPPNPYLVNGYPKPPV